MDTFGKSVTALTLIPGGGGIFDVSLNKELIFSKNELDRFPEKGEIPKKIRSLPRI
ncbi:MAG: hypothetical protein HY731_05945 [Candidatus Tectomicrobia bacterium]|nr:hypothetical protein [Candidatus Tectomicrobia bacterium]